MRFLGKHFAGDIVDFKFNTVDTDFAPITLAGTPSLAVYKDNGTTEDASVTLTVDFDSKTGLHHVRVDTSADTTFFTPGATYQVGIAAGTVDGISVVGAIVGEFVLRPHVDAEIGSVRYGTAQAGAAGTVTLDSGASASDDAYNAKMVAIVAGTGVGQSRYIDDYTGSSKVADVSPNWGTNPDDTSRFVVYEAPPPSTATLPSVAIPDGALTNAKFANDAITASKLHADVTTELQSGLATAAALATLDGKVDAVDNLIDGEIADIQSRLPAALVGGRMDSSVGAMAANVLTNAAIANDALTASKLHSDVTTELQTGLATAAALATLDGKVDTIDNFFDTEFALLIADVAAILADTGTDGVVVAAASKTGYRLSATGVDDILDEVVEGAVTLRQSCRLVNALLGGKASGLDTTEATYRDIGDTKDRVVATVDEDGNRTALTLDLT